MQWHPYSCWTFRKNSWWCHSSSPFHHGYVTWISLLEWYQLTSTLEKKDARRLTKIIKKEAKTEAQAVQTSIKELERLCSLQKEAATAERKSQLRLTKWTTREHKARMRFLKEKERYEKIEGELRNAENDFEERRDHAAGLTAQVAEKVSHVVAKASRRRWPNSS